MGLIAKRFPIGFFVTQVLSGACAIAVVSRLPDLTDNAVDITLPGGTLKISWDGQGEVYLERGAVQVFEGE